MKENTCAWCGSTLAYKKRGTRGPFCWLVQHRFCKFPAGWFCAATLPRRTSPAGDFFGVFFPTFTKESTTWHNA